MAVPLRGWGGGKALNIKKFCLLGMFFIICWKTAIKKRGGGEGINDTAIFLRLP